MNDPFNSDQFVQKEVKRLVRAHGIQTIIETGTHEGNTTRVMASMVPRVITLELDKEYFSKGDHLEILQNVTRLRADSAEVFSDFGSGLPWLLPHTLRSPTLFYLDAHGESHSPLLDELEGIIRSKIRPVIVIHDFCNPFRPEFGSDTWDIGHYKLDLIEPYLNRIYGEHGWDHHYNLDADGQKRGVIYIEPYPVPEPVPKLHSPSVDIVYASYKNDLCWLVYSIQFLLKHLRGAYRIVVRLNADCEDVIKDWRLPVTYHFVKPWPDSYAFQMYLKSTADQYSEAELIMLIDSDHMLLEPVDVVSFLNHGGPVVHYRNWDDDPNDSSLVVGRQIWGPPVQRTLGMPLDRDYMIGTPFTFWRSTFAAMRSRVEKVVGLPFHDAIYSDVPYDYRNFLNHPMKFCDYEALGLYASKFESDRYVLKHHAKGTHWPIRNYWSHGDWSRELMNYFDEVLAK